MTTALSTPLLARLPRGGRWLLGLVVHLHLARDVGGKDRLQPLSGTAANDPCVSGGYRASKASGKAGGTQGKAFVPGHVWMLPRKIKCAMRKIILVKGYAMRILCACPTPHKPPSKTQSSSTPTAFESQ